MSFIMWDILKSLILCSDVAAYGSNRQAVHPITRYCLRLSAESLICKCLLHSSDHKPLPINLNVNFKPSEVLLGANAGKKQLCI